ncbi:hypothetical protein LP420_18390 [Massilia sp. B-10]|nr:hypothetical protein LP420_18390 [Massilia sp. B-10]
MVVARVSVEGTDRINPKVLEVQSGIVPGQSMTREQVRGAADMLYGRADLERVETEIDDEGGKRSVTIKATEAPWATSRLRVGLELASDFDDANRFALKLLHVRTSMNSWGGELRTLVQARRPARPRPAVLPAAGARLALVPGPFARVQLDLARQLPGLSRLRASLRLFRQRRRAGAGARAGQLWRHPGRRDAPAGRGALGDSGRPARHGAARLRHQPVRAVPRRHPRFARFPQPRLPARGAHGARAGRQRRRRGRGPLDPDRDGGDQRRQLGLAMCTANTPTRTMAIRRSAWAASCACRAPCPISIQGKTVAFGRLVLARRIGALPVTLGGTVRAGFSLEVGGGFDLSQPSVGASVKQAVSGFLSVDTRFGPAYVGGYKRPRKATARCTCSSDRSGDTSSSGSAPPLAGTHATFAPPRRLRAMGPRQGGRRA